MRRHLQKNELIFPQSCSSVILKTWDREGMIKVDVPYLLPALNEALQLSPVLVQAYSYGPYGVEPQMADVIFPIEDCLVPESSNESMISRLPAFPPSSFSPSSSPSYPSHRRLQQRQPTHPPDGPTTLPASHPQTLLRDPQDAPHQ